MYTIIIDLRRLHYYYGHRHEWLLVLMRASEASATLILHFFIPTQQQQLLQHAVRTPTTAVLEPTADALFGWHAHLSFHFSHYSGWHT